MASLIEILCRTDKKTYYAVVEALPEDVRASVPRQGRMVIFAVRAKEYKGAAGRKAGAGSRKTLAKASARARKSRKR